MTNKEIIEVVQGWADGKKVAYCCKGTDIWIETTAPFWDWFRCDYKIISREFWINRYKSGGFSIHSSEELAENFTRKECIHVKEVL